MFCFRCGATMPDEAPTCPQCGTPVSEAPQVPLRLPTPAPPVLSYPATASVQQPDSSGQKTDGNATASMVFGILSLACLGVVAGIPAVILGHVAKSNIRKSMGRLGGGGLATSGLIMGYISIVVSAAALAVVIPRFRRLMVPTSPSQAAASVRNIQTAEIAYSLDYPAAGYARNLATLGPGPSGVCRGKGTREHACLIGADLACGGVTCIVHGYRVTLTATCGQTGPCADYLVAAIPLTRDGILSFCSTSDAVLRYSAAVDIRSPPDALACQTWDPVEK